MYVLHSDNIYIDLKKGIFVEEHKKPFKAIKTKTTTKQKNLSQIYITGRL